MSVREQTGELVKSPKCEVKSLKLVYTVMYNVGITIIHHPFGNGLPTS